MILKNASQKELVDYISSLTTYSSIPFFIVNNQYKVEFINKAFEQMVQKEENRITWFDFGDSLGCNYLSKDGKSCGHNYYCNLCSIRQAIDSILQLEQASITTEFVRDFVISGEVIFRKIIFTAFLITLEDKNYVGLLINQSIS